MGTGLSVKTDGVNRCRRDAVGLQGIVDGGGNGRSIVVNQAVQCQLGMSNGGFNIAVIFGKKPFYDPEVLGHLAGKFPAEKADVANFPIAKLGDDDVNGIERVSGHDAEAAIGFSVIALSSVGGRIEQIS